MNIVSTSRKRSTGRGGSLWNYATERIVVALVSIFTTMLTAVLTPLGDYVRALIKPEHVRLSIAGSHAPTQGRLWPVRVILSPYAGNEISGGRLNVTWKPEDVFCTNDGSTMQSLGPILVDKFSQDIELPVDHALEFNVCKVEPFTMIAEFTNVKGKQMSKTESFEALAAKQSVNPAKDNLGGIWWFQIFDEKDVSTLSGVLNLHDDSGNLSGSFHAQNGPDQGGVSGHHDSGFYLELRDYGADTEWQLRSGPPLLKNGFLTLDGDVKLVELQKKSTKMLRTLRFHADAKALGEVAFGQ